MSTSYYNNSIASVTQELKDAFEIDIPDNQWVLNTRDYLNLPTVNPALRGVQMNYYTARVRHNQNTENPLVYVYQTGADRKQLVVAVHVVDENTIELKRLFASSSHVIVMGGTQPAP